jgi:hypothetical protein
VRDSGCEGGMVGQRAFPVTAGLTPLRMRPTELGCISSSGVDTELPRLGTASGTGGCIGPAISAVDHSTWRFVAGRGEMSRSAAATAVAISGHLAAKTSLQYSARARAWIAA